MRKQDDQTYSFADPRSADSALDTKWNLPKITRIYKEGVESGITHQSTPELTSKHSGPTAS
jgi:hypothetical protein